MVYFFFLFGLINEPRKCFRLSSSTSFPREVVVFCESFNGGYHGHRVWSQLLTPQCKKESLSSVFMATAGKLVLSVKWLHPYCVQIFLHSASQSHPFMIFSLFNLLVYTVIFFSCGWLLFITVFQKWDKAILSLLLLPLRYDPNFGVFSFSRWMLFLYISVFLIYFMFFILFHFCYLHFFYI